MPKAELDGNEMPDDKLESWKEIASYVDRTVSTVKRWERSEGLPVHRHIHRTQGSVYASKAEIDDWRKNRSHDPEPKGASAARAWRGRALAFAALLAAALLSWLLVPLGQRAGSLDDRSHPRIWVLVTDFGNSTDESLFDGTIAHAMKQSLSFSPRLAVVPQERIDDAFRLMRRSLDATIDPVLAREICQRDGGIDAIVTGRVEAASSGFRLFVRILDPTTGATVAARSAEAPDGRGILPVVEGLGEWVRNSLGEEINLRTSDRAELEKATTSSLKALQLYSRGMKMGYRHEWLAAGGLFEQAVGEDPDFASAQIMLAWAIHNQIPPLERDARTAEFMTPAERALELSTRLPDSERLWIEGSYLSLSRRHAEATARYEALFGLHPEHYWAANNLSLYYLAGVSHRDNPKAIARGLRFLKAKTDLRPNDFLENAWAAYNLAYNYADFDGAAVYARRATALEPSIFGADTEFEADPALAQLAVEMRLLPAWKSFVDGDPEPLSEALGRVESDAAPEFEVDLSWYHLQLGQIEKARSLVRFLREPAYRHWLAAEIAYSLDRGETLRRELKLFEKEPPSKRWYGSDYALVVRAGLVEESEAKWRIIMEETATRPFFPPEPDLRRALRGLRALSRGNLEDADRWIEAGMACPLSDGAFLLVSEAQAESLQQRGRTEEAAGSLERALARRGAVAFFYHYAWRLEVRLSRLYRSLGRVEEAQAVENRLLSRLSLADPDHPAVLAVRDDKAWLEP